MLILIYFSILFLKLVNKELSNLSDLSDNIYIIDNSSYVYFANNSPYVYFVIIPLSTCFPFVLLKHIKSLLCLQKNKSSLHIHLCLFDKQQYRI
jgi:hypothetical protein